MKIAPSILSADLGKLNEEIKEIEKHADLLHVDIMDGHFVPNLTFGPVLVRSIKTRLPLDCHLMISNPLKYAKEFSKYCDMISFHASLFPTGLDEAIKNIKELGVKVGLALNPKDPLDIILPVLDELDYVLIMSVKAGFAGQEFKPEVLEKIKNLRKKGFKKDIEIDGGIDPRTIKLAREAGATIAVAGSSIFGKKDREKAIQELRD